MSRVLLLAGAIAAVSVPLFVGHGLAVHSSRVILLGVGMGVLAAVLVGLHMRTARPDADA
ncbi:MAG TPA: hypothetical protein VF192_01660 [Longimicrobiales bacterium]